jgi:hypothetical protein
LDIRIKSGWIISIPTPIWSKDYEIIEAGPTYIAMEKLSIWRTLNLFFHFKTQVQEKNFFQLNKLIVKYFGKQVLKDSKILKFSSFYML